MGLQRGQLISDPAAAATRHGVHNETPYYIYSLSLLSYPHLRPLPAM